MYKKQKKIKELVKHLLGQPIKTGISRCAFTVFDLCDLCLCVIALQVFDKFNIPPLMGIKILIVLS